MRRSDIVRLFTLAALWGASCLFLRMGAGEFGPAALSAVRVTGASLLLLPMLQLRGQTAELRRHWRPIFVVGVTNSALPFLCFSYAALSVTAGLSAIFNAASRLFGAVIAWLWLKYRLTQLRIAGLVMGFAGVLWHAWDKARFKPGGSGWATVACLAATTMYGLSASFTKRYLVGVAPMAAGAGSQLSAALVLLIPAIVFWPSTAPSTTAWLTAAVLALFCTGMAYVLYFRLIVNVGPANAIAVTFLVPVFAVVCGWVPLEERITPAMLLGCAVILLGTGLTTGLLKLQRRPTHAANECTGIASTQRDDAGRG